MSQGSLPTWGVKDTKERQRFGRLATVERGNTTLRMDYTCSTNSWLTGDAYLGAEVCAPYRSAT